MNDKELLDLIKKEAKCKTNQCLLNTLERLGDLVKVKVRRAVYLTESKSFQGKHIETPPEFDYVK